MEQFEPDQVIVTRQRWRGLLWSAVPAIVVADDGETLVQWTPGGAIGCYASSRGYPGRDHLDRGARQIAAMETSRWLYRGAPTRGSSLQFVVAGSHARVAPTWYPDGGPFAHWYVDLVQPAVRFDGGHDSMDLILDLVVAPDRTWAWKDRDDFDAALEAGVLDRSIEPTLLDAADEVLALLDRQAGPFDPSWLAWRPDPSWPMPVLPGGFAGGVPVPEGSAVSLEP